MRRESNRTSKEQQNYMALLGIPSSVGSQSSQRSQQKGPTKERDIISIEQPLESSFSSLPEIQEIDEDFSQFLLALLLVLCWSYLWCLILTKMGKF